MTMPSEELRSLLRVRDLVHHLYIESFTWWNFLILLLSPRARKAYRDRLDGVSRHYPFPGKIKRKWSDEVCPDCGQDYRWCRCK